MKIGNLVITEKAALAPMAGVADRAFRELCRGYGAAYTVCEMASAKGISLGDKKSAELLSISESERPAGSQIFGNSSETMHWVLCLYVRVRSFIIRHGTKCIIFIRR